MSDDDFEKIRREFIFEQVPKTIKETPKNWANRPEELGFQWFDDDVVVVSPVFLLKTSIRSDLFMSSPQNP